MKIKKIEKEIKNILCEKNNLKLQYAFQPVYEIECFGNVYSYKIIGYEALLRKTEIYGKNIYELLNFFIKQGKGFIFHLFLLNLALSNLKNFSKEKIFLFFNLSPEIFTEKEFAFEQIIEIINFHDYNLKNIIFEITENYSNSIYDCMILKLYKIKKNYKDVIFAIDDFGTGNNNGRFFKDLQPYFIKIDRCFVQNSKDFLFLRKMIDFFYGYTQIIIEGIETEEQFLRCLHTNATFFQGYYLKKPFFFEEKCMNSI